MITSLRSRLDPAPHHVPPPGDRLAAVLAPLFTDGEPSLLFTRRRENLTRHAGEISFPGGLPDGDGEDLATTALRETEEEIGVAPSDVELLGALPPVHTTVSGILIVPFVGAIAGDPEIRPNPAEIADVFRVEVARLIEVESVVELSRGEHRFDTYLFEVGENIIWGATGRVLHDLLMVWKGGTDG